MRLPRIIKRLLIIISVLLALLIGLSCYMNFVYLKDFRLRVEEQLTKVLEAKVGISSLSFDIFRGVTAHKIQISSKKGPIVSIGVFQAGFDYKELRQRKFSLKDIEFKDVDILVSDISNNNTAYLQNMKNKFTKKKGPNESAFPIRLEVENVKFDNVAVLVGDRTYPIDKLSFLKKDGKTVIAAGVKNFLSLVKIDISSVVSNKLKKIDAHLVFLKPEIRRVAETCRLSTSFTDAAVLPVEITTAGSGLSWNGFALVKTASQSIEFPASANTAEFRGVRAVFSGALRNFNLLNFQFDISADGLSAALLKPEISGLLKVNARISGSLKQKIFKVDQGEISSERLEVTHLLTNVLSLRTFSMKLRNNRVTELSTILQNGTEIYSLTASTGDLFAEKIGLDIQLKSDQASLDKIRWDGSIIKPSSSTNKRSVSVNLAGVFDKVSYNNLRLENVTIKAKVDQGVVTAEQFGFSSLGGQWNGSFKLVEKILSFSAGFKNVAIAPARTHLAGELNGTYDIKNKFPYITGTVHDTADGFSKFECTDLHSSIRFSNTMVSMPDLTAVAYHGKISASVLYDIADRKGGIQAEATSVNVGELYQALLGPTTSRFSGVGKLDCSIDLGSNGPEYLKGTFRFEKGIIQDTIYQQDFAKRINNETIRDIILYDHISSGFSFSDKILRIDGLEFISTDLEVRMSLDYNTSTRKRSSIEPYKILMSDAFIQNFNVLQLPLSLVTSKNGQWALLQIKEKENHIEIIKISK